MGSVLIRNPADGIDCIGRTWAAFDEMTWPRANRATGDVEWRIRHSHTPPTPEDLMVAASIIAAYRELVHCPRSKREAVIRRLREVESIAAILAVSRESNKEIEL